MERRAHTSCRACRVVGMAVRPVRAHASEIEVRFTEDSREQTTVEIEHSFLAGSSAARRYMTQSARRRLGPACWTGSPRRSPTRSSGMPIEDRKRKAHEAIVTRALEGDGRASRAQRRGAFDNAGLAEPLSTLIDKVAKHAYKVTDEDIAAVKA